ncbi:hypothetical protein [Enterococcus pallens]|uniref:Uncharacterized protein n=1 Tax=Enterococcus pallens ATCC BAA-351 TaxID=1158607 RepID=R2QEC4_9ENTE|nr:hypothetical protein [Enterococcus pallens]EOH94842.1 hypothetical protein UAU_01764 [Enterococcus pallens ATCC BAA-351]EOU14839.1 hypothetical protein I588_04489 [Enterococcus pallens ATCC BAA-351]
MRLREQDLQTCYLRKRINTTDEEGNSITTYSEESIELRMNIQSAGGKVAAEIYGERLPYMKACKYQGDQLIEGENEGDGICVNVSKDADPDYKILAIQSFSQHLNITLERLG